MANEVILPAEKLSALEKETAVALAKLVMRVEQLENHVDSLVEYMTEAELRNGVRMNKLLETIKQDKDGILESIDVMRKVQIDDQQRKERKESEWQQWKKFLKLWGISLVVCFLLAAGVGMKAETLEKLALKAIESLL